MESKDKIIQQIDIYYESWFEINNIYHIWARKRGIQDTTLFVLYVIKNTKSYCTQNQICSKAVLPKQTVSLILAGLEKDGYIIRELNTEDRRNKIVRFTEEGERFAGSILEELKAAEIEAFGEMSLEQRKAISESFKVLSDSLVKSLSK